MAAMHTEMEEKVKNGYAKIHNYGDIKGKSRNLNISPVAMIPHKFRAFRNILDLSLWIKHVGTLMDFLNSDTFKHVSAEYMVR